MQRRSGVRFLRTVVGLAVASSLVLGACSPTPVAPSPSSPLPVGTASPAPTQASIPTPAPTVDRATGWRSDLERLIPGMDAIHPNLTHGTTRAALDDAVTTLIGEIDISTDDRLMVGVLRIVAMVSAAGCDGHTGAFIWGTGSYPVDSLPLRLWLFDDEVVIVDALPPYERYVGSRIDAIEGRPIAEVLDALEPLIPRDGEQTVRLLTPRYLLTWQVLHGLGIADSGPVALELTEAGGTGTVVLIDPIPMAEYNAWAGPYGLHLPVDPEVMYLARIDDALWWQVLPDTETLYIQYNRVEHLTDGTVGELRAAVEGPDVTRIIVDARHNFGGELTALDPVVAMLTGAAIEPDQVYVLTGRNTFSAGSILVARLDEAGATIVGEPMGGCPTLFGDSSELLLPFSRIAVSVAGDVAIGVDPNDERQTIEPDVIATLTREDWSDGRDPALEAIVIVAP